MGTSVKRITIGILVFGFGHLFPTTKLLGAQVKKSQSRIFNQERQLFEIYDQYKDVNGGVIVGLIVKAKRNDSVFIRGVRIDLGDHILFKEFYNYGHTEFDSVIRKVVKTKNTKLILKEVTWYKGSKIIRNYISPETEPD